MSTYLYSDAVTQLQKSGNILRFRYERLDALNNSKGFLGPVVQQGGTVDHTYSSAIKRTGSLTLLDVDSSIFDFNSDRIRIWVGVLMPDMVTWWDFPIGVFLTSSPDRAYVGGLITRPCSLYDQSQILVDLEPTNISLYGGYYLAAGSVYTDEIVNILNGAGITDINIVASALTLPTDQSWQKGNPLITSQQINNTTTWSIGANALTIINDLLRAINYAPLWFDGHGQAQCQPFQRPDNAPIDHIYTTSNMSIILPTVNQNFDLFSIPNVIILAVVQPDRPQLVSQFVNSDPTSPVSTVSRRRRVVRIDTSQTAADQSTLDALAHQQAIDAANIYEKLTWSSLPLPTHDDRDIIQFTHTGLGLNAIYAETKWSMSLQAGGVMSHEMQRVVNIEGSLIGDPDSGA